MAMGYNQRARKPVCDYTLFVTPYLQGQSCREIASIFDVGISTVRLYLKRQGILRAQSDAIELAGRQGKMARSHVKGFVHSDLSRLNMSNGRKKYFERVGVGGVSLKQNGYMEYTTGKNKGRSVHRVLMEEHLGRKLLKREHVHHIDGNKTNNLLENLEVMDIKEHMSHHARVARRTRNSKGQFK